MQYKRMIAGFLFFALSLSANQLYTAPNGRRMLITNEGQWHLALQSDIMADQLLASTLLAASDPFDLTAPTSGGVVQMQSTVPTNKDEGPFVDIIGTTQGFVFREVSWGMNVSQVKTAEKARLVKESSTQLDYKFSEGMLTARFSYVFTGGKLSNVTVAITQPKTSPSEYYRSLEQLTLHLCKMYSEPTARDYAWTDESLKNDRSRWGLAISRGQLTCRFTWHSTTSAIDVRARGAAGVFTTNLEFSLP